MAELNLQKRLKLLALLSSLLVSQITLAQSIQPSPQIIDWRDVLIKSGIAIIAAILAFLFNLYLTRRKEKNENKQLSYEIRINDAITKNEIPIKDKIKINYNGNHLENLSFASIYVQNTGKILIKDEILRFQFPDNSRILEQYFDPKPEEELGVHEETVDPSRYNFERKIRIGHLTKGQGIKIHFVITGEDVLPVIHGFNPDGDVSFNERSFNVKLNDQETVRHFLYDNLIVIIILSLVVPIFIAFFKARDPQFIEGIGERYMIVTVELLTNYKYINPITRIFSELLFRRRQSDDPQTEIRVVGNSNMIVQHSQGGIFDMNSKSNRKGNREGEL